MKKYFPIVLMIFALATTVIIVSKSQLYNYYYHIAIMVGIYIILSSSLDVLLGYTGQISLCHVALQGIGAYVSANLMLNYGLSFWIAFPLSGLIASLVGIGIGYSSIRFKALYFAIVTFAFGGIISILMNNLKGLTNGPQGMRGIPSPGTIKFLDLTVDFSGKLEYVLLVYAVVFLTIYLKINLIHSRVGRAFMSIRDNEVLATAIGINTTYYKLLSIGTASFFAGIAGCLLAHYMRFISPALFSPWESFMALIIVIVGGAGTVLGPIVGSIFWVVMPEAIKGLEDYTFILFGVLLVITVIVMPKGIIGGFEYLFSKIGIKDKKLWNFWKLKV